MFSFVWKTNSNQDSHEFLFLQLVHLLPTYFHHLYLFDIFEFAVRQNNFQVFTTAVNAIYKLATTSFYLTLQNCTLASFYFLTTSG